MTIGRNDPCPCGSGRKYKKCHGVGEPAPAIAPASAASREAERANALKARDVELAERLMRFGRTQHGPNWLHDAFASEGLLDRGKPREVEAAIAIPWLLHYRVDANGATLVEEWRRHQHHRISRDDELLLQAYGAAWLSIWEVAKVEPGRGSLLVDALTREERFVRDVSSSRMLKQFDAMLAIVLDCDGISFFGGAHAQPLPPRHAAALVQAARKMCRVRTRPIALDKLRDPDMQLLLIELWREGVKRMKEQPPPLLQNTDGDPLVLTSDHYSLVGAREEIARRLGSLPGVEEEPDHDGDDIIFVVTKPGNAAHASWDSTVLGRLVLSDTRLAVETNSVRRADALRSMVEAQLERLVNYRVREEKNTTELLAALRASRIQDKLPRETASPELQAIAREYRARHMKQWLDESIPALDGFTPRHAAQLPRVRPKLELLLKELDQAEARLPEGERIDLRWLRETLGIP